MANRLADQTSPYLLQHADNPVDWYPWGEEALEKARSEDKPILLSIGYSACHWCHVMAHESFEDEDVASLMNRLFVNIKVDREERPELDKIYQLSHQILAQRPGGWPLTMFLAPDQTPFFGGTYFPKEARFGMPGFPDLLERVAAYYAEHAEEIRKQNQALKDFFVELSGRGAEKMASELDDRALAHCREVLEQEFDDRFGGFGKAPKFPHPTSISRLLRHWHRTAPTTEPDKQALYMAAATLTRMAMGGIYDQLGGGFCRYSVDDLWMIPHFEKMLYDNGPLLGIYAQAGRATGEHAFARTAAETAGWVMREMESPEGGYYASLDADSEGEEGRYYVWDRTEVQALLGADYDLFAARYGLDREPNFEGRWHLHVFEDEQSLASRFRLDQDEVRRRMDEARQRLLAVRDARIRPGCDDKVLVAWNGMMVRGMAQAARHLERPELSRSAARAVDFIRDRLWSGGRLRTAWRDGRAGADGLLDDYALLLDGILELLQARWDSRHLAFAVELAEALLAHFRDEASGAFFFTPHDHEDLIHRPLPLADDATPSGNGVAAYALQRLGHLLGETRYLEAAEDVLKAAKADMEKIPQAHTSLMDALEEALDPPETIVIRGDEAELGTWHQAVSPWYMPRRQIYAIPTGEELPGLLAERKASDEGPIAYVCKGMQCDAPIRSLEALVHLVGVPA